MLITNTNTKDGGSWVRIAILGTSYLYHTTKVKSVIHECWRAGEKKELGKEKISAAGVYDRLEKMQLQKTIRLSKLPLPGKILAVYKSIGSKPQASSAGCYKRGRPLSNAGVSGKKKAKVCYSDRRTYIKVE